MNLRFLLALSITLCFNSTLFSQTKSSSDILPKDIQANPILDSMSYLPDTLKQPVIDILKTKTLKFYGDQ